MYCKTQEHAWIKKDEMNPSMLLRTICSVGLNDIYFEGCVFAENTTPHMMTSIRHIARMCVVTN